MLLQNQFMALVPGHTAPTKIVMIHFLKTDRSNFVAFCGSTEATRSERDANSIQLFYRPKTSSFVLFFRKKIFLNDFKEKLFQFLSLRIEIPDRVRNLCHVGTQSFPAQPNRQIVLGVTCLLAE